MMSYISPPGSDRTNKLVSWGLLLHGTRENPVNLKPGSLTPTPPGPEVTATQPGVSGQKVMESFVVFLRPSHFQSGWHIALPLSILPYNVPGQGHSQGHLCHIETFLI